MERLQINNNQSLDTISQKLYKNQVSTNNSFAQVFDKINHHQELIFSKHAIQRLQARNIQLNDDEIVKIKHALHKAEKKGIKEALIFMGDKAFVASVKNKTIITATLGKQLKDSIFTNIDGAVIL